MSDDLLQRLRKISADDEMTDEAAIKALALRLRGRLRLDAADALESMLAALAASREECAALKKNAERFEWCLPLLIERLGNDAIAAIDSAMALYNRAEKR